MEVSKKHPLVKKTKQRTIEHYENTTINYNLETGIGIHMFGMLAGRFDDIFYSIFFPGRPPANKELCPKFWNK